ncbi:MAG TPA: hypothetical protein VNW29_00970 [Candidatus Sulfotelmatobacter sp.]|jgi:hypothetical protein|nr:hypothetical protein [Candidatus Sulfotelmatobacter sp.]
MKLLTLFFGKNKSRKTIADYQREKLVNFGKQQFQRMMELGIGTPIKLV